MCCCLICKGGWKSLLKVLLYFLQTQGCSVGNNFPDAYTYSQQGVWGLHSQFASCQSLMLGGSLSYHVITPLLHSHGIPSLNLLTPQCQSSAKVL